MAALVEIYERNNLGDPLRTVPFEWYVQGRERIVELRLQVLEDSGMINNISMFTQKIDTTPEGGDEMVDGLYFAARLAGQTEWTPLGEFFLSFGLNANEFVDFDLRLLVPSPTSSAEPNYCPLNPTDSQIERATCYLRFRGVETETLHNEYGTFAYETQDYEEGNPDARLENLIDYLILDAVIYTAPYTFSIEEAGVIFPS